MSTAPAETKTNKLFEAFDKPACTAWRAAAEETLKGVPFDKKLLTPTPEGITLKPIYTAEDVAGLDVAGLPGQTHLLRGATPAEYLARPWQVAQETLGRTPEEFNKALLEDLNHGQTAINIPLDMTTRHGLPLSSVEDFQKAFAGVYWNAVPVYWQMGLSGLPVMSLWVAYLKRQKIKLREIKGALDLNPLETWLKTGTLPISLEKVYDELASALAWAKKEMPAMGVIGVDATVYANAGASGVEELAYVISATVEYVQAMGARGFSAKDTFARIRWIFSVGPHFFTEVAKFRAARLLWTNLVAAYGLKVDDCPPRFHARTGVFNKTIYDPHVNILRTTMEAFAAITGGIESLHVGPFDEVLRAPDQFSRRIARNTQTILREECGLDRVIDPAGGSYYIENLTVELAGKSWEKFRCLANAGGFVEAITSGELQRHIAATAAEREKRFTQRRDVLVGTNLYAVAKEIPSESATGDLQGLHARVMEVRDQRGVMKVLERLTSKMKGNPSADVVHCAADAAAAGATLAEITGALRAVPSSAPEVQVLSLRRLSSPYEQLRGECHRKNAKVFLATMGPVRQHKGRADFIRDFFEAGGIEVIYLQGFASADEVAQAARKSGARVTVICSTDDTYPTLVPEVAKALKSAMPGGKVYLAGQPAPEFAAAYREAGMDDFISIKSNNLETLRKIVSFY